MLGLPDGVAACLFDLDGVLTDTAAVHDRAWTEMFDAYLRERAERRGGAFVPFDPDADYHRVRRRQAARGRRARVPGQPRHPAARGRAGRPAGRADRHGLGNRKNELLLRAIDRDGVEVFEGSRAYLEAASDAGLRRAVVSSSANTRQVLDVTGLAACVELRVDGVTMRTEHLRGKPAPDTFLAAAERLGVGPDQAAVFEDAARRRRGRPGRRLRLRGRRRPGRPRRRARAHGADVVVSDLAELLAER